MTNYSLKPSREVQPIPSWLEAKEKRKKQLEEVRNRRRAMYELMRKMRLQTSRQ